MKWRSVIIFLVCAFTLSVVVLAIFHCADDPGWIIDFPASAGSNGVLWQVQTTFLSVGFAGIAIAAQLFAETPLAVGASRGRVLGQVQAGRFVAVGLTANAVIAIETIWLASSVGALLITFFWFVPTVVLLVSSYVRLMGLFGNPMKLDEVVRISLVNALHSRMDTMSQRSATSRPELDSLLDSGFSGTSPSVPTVTIHVPVPRDGLVVKGIRPKAVRRAIELLGPQLTEAGEGDDGIGNLFVPHRIVLEIEPGDRVRMGQTAFRISSSHVLDGAVRDRLVQLLQSSIEFEPAGSVTPDEETGREIASLKDAVGTSLRSGAYGTADRALELLGHVVRGVWTVQPRASGFSRRSSRTRRDWLYRTIDEVEQDALLSPRACELFVGQAIARAIEAPKTGSMEYVDECMRSFTRLWGEVLQSGDDAFGSMPFRIVTCVQDLAAYSYAIEEQRDDLQARAVWVVVELVKLALDAKSLENAELAATALNELFEFGDSSGSGRANVRAGQLVLGGWLDYLEDKEDARAPGDGKLRALVTPQGTWTEILAARTLTERSATPFSLWEWWEMRKFTSAHVQRMELPHYVDRAELAALATSFGPLPPATEQETASEYKRLVRLLGEVDRELSAGEVNLQQALAEEVRRWDAAEGARLAQEPLSQSKVVQLRNSIQETVDTIRKLATAVFVVDDIPEQADRSRPILGMNLRVPRHYLVDRIFNETYSDTQELGKSIALAFVDGEDHRIVEELRSQQNNLLDPTADAIRQKVECLGIEAEHYVLVTPYGGLDDPRDWHSDEFREAMHHVTHIETGALDNEAILFDRRSTVALHSVPEEKEGLIPVEGTSIAVGIFDDVQDEDEPRVRIEAGELFLIWTADAPRVYRFAPQSAGEAGL